MTSKNTTVDVYTGEKVQRLEGENGVVARVVTDKRTLDADLVIFATGFAPNTALARAAGLDLEERTGAILVNEYMQTSDPDIYAGGDCVAIPNLITGKPSWRRSAPSPTGRTRHRHQRRPATMARRPPSTAPWARGA